MEITIDKLKIYDFGIIPSMQYNRSLLEATIVEVMNRNGSEQQINRGFSSVNFVFLQTLAYLRNVFGAAEYKTFYIICSRLSESPPRNKNEQKYIPIEKGTYSAGFLILVCGLW